MKKYIYIVLTTLFTATALTSCQPEEFDAGNGLADPNVDAAFAISQVDNAGNRFELQPTKEGVIRHLWELGDGSPAYFSNNEFEEVFFPDAGTYTVSHTAFGRGGLSNTTMQEIVVATSDPVAGNLVKGGKFENAEDHAQWTVLNISASGAAWTFNQGSATINATQSNQQGIFQAIEVEAGKPYTIDMTVSGSGATDVWFEVFASPTAPTQNSDYSAGGTRIGLNTWAGCGNAPFNAKLSSISCSGSGNIVQFDTSGTIYLTIKCGGANTGTTGITIDNVEFRGVPQN